MTAVRVARAEKPVRSGLTLGVGIGAGAIKDDKSQAAAGAFSFRAGWSAAPTLVVSGEIDVNQIGKNQLGVVGGMTFFGAVVSWFPIDRVYAVAGVGASHLFLTGTDSTVNSKDAGALLLGGGLEVYRPKPVGLAITVELRFWVAKFDQTFGASSLGIGLQWY